MNSIINTVKAHPVAAILIAAAGGYAFRYWHTGIMTAEQRALNVLLP